MPNVVKHIEVLQLVAIQ